MDAEHRPFSEQMLDVLRGEPLGPAEDAVFERSLAEVWEPPVGEMHERVRRTQEDGVPLRLRMRLASRAMTSACEPDGTVKLPRDAAHFLAALLDHLADRVPVDTDDYDAAFARGLLGD